MLHSTGSIPNRIDEYLDYHCYSKERIAEKIGVTTDDFADMLSMSKAMTADVFVRLCIELGKTAEYLANFCVEESA